MIDAGFLQELDRCGRELLDKEGCRLHGNYMLAAAEKLRAVAQQAEAVPSDVVRVAALENSDAESMWLVARNKDSFTVALSSHRGAVTRKTLREAIDAAIAQQKGASHE